MKLSEVQVRQEIRAQIVKLLKEVRGSVEADVLMSSLARLPDALRSAFPGVGHRVVRGQKEILPFDFIQEFVRYPPVFLSGSEVRFGMHLGDAYRELLVSKDELALVVKFIGEWLSRRGWYIFSSGLGDRGERLSVSALPKNNPFVTPGDFMYHLTDLSSVEGIKKRGLLPRGSDERGFSPRVYLFTNVDALNRQAEENREAWAETGFRWNPTLTKTPEAAVIVLDPRAFRKGTKFEVDPEYLGDPGYVYTKSHIPPDAIVKIIPVNENYNKFSIYDQNINKREEK
jgi:hypothetical protein